MEAYSGFEPRVGEIRAVRTFRIGPEGRLYPLFSNTDWPNGAHTAQCIRAALTGETPHAAPDPECTCGIYAYANLAAATEYPNSRHVLAVIACWGRIIAGTRGIRAEHARIEVLWMSPRVPPNLATQVVGRYPAVRIYDRPSVMFAKHPLTELDCYQPDAQAERAIKRIGLHAAIAVALPLGLFPAHWFGSNNNGRIVCGVELAFFLVGAVAMGRRSEPVARRRTPLFVAVALWLLAPFAGPVGVVLLRLPLLQIAAILFVHHLRMAHAANQFPADISQASS